MLTSDLLVTRTSKGKIEPVYALRNLENLEVASSVIDVFQEHVGRTYGELIGELEGVEEINYRLIRGLAQILERRCVISENSDVDPIAARRAVFEESRGFITRRGREGEGSRQSLPGNFQSNLTIWKRRAGQTGGEPGGKRIFKPSLRMICSGSITYRWLKVYCSRLPGWRFG